MIRHAFRPNGGSDGVFTIPPDGRMDLPDDVIRLQEMKYDSTGMFHWCPARALEDCILVSVTRLTATFAVRIATKRP